MEIPRFHELEYEALHNEIRSNHDRIFNVIVYVTIANGFIAAWILQENIVAVSSFGTIATAAFIPLY